MGQELAKKERINWIDTARGYGIILVIMGHVQMGEALWSKIFMGEIYSFHMPLFFIISGYLLSATKYNFKEFFVKRAKGLLLPYLYLGLVIIAANWLFYNFGDPKALLNYFKLLIIQNRFHVIWYLLCLFVSEIVFYFIVKILDNKKWQILIICTGIAGIGLAYYATGGKPLPWNIDVCPTAIFFIAVGYALKGVEIKRDWYYLVLAIAINIVCVALNMKFAGCELEMFGGQYAIVPFTVLAALAGVYVVYWISYKKEFKAIAYFGHHSLVYFGLHQALTLTAVGMICDSQGWFRNKNNIFQGLGFVIISTLVSLALLTLVQFAISAIKKQKEQHEKEIS